MRLTNEVVLPAQPETVFALINDVERVAPCLPGATLEGKADEDAYQGRIKIKVGPISAAYQGNVRFLEVDEPDNRVVLDAKGSEQHGSGNAEAKVEVRVRPHDDGSVLLLDTDLVVRGKVAQFGRGALAGVSQKLMEQFATNLSGLLTAAEPAASPAAAPRHDARPEPEADGTSLVVMPLLKRIAPAAAALTVGVLAGRLLGRPRRNVIAHDRIDAMVHIGPERIPVTARRVVMLGEK